MNCKHCGATNHTSLFCWKHPRIVGKKKIVAMKVSGNRGWFNGKGEHWLKFRQQYLNDNPPNHQGYYECYRCGEWIPAK